MADNNHPVTPTPELVRKWQSRIEYCSKRVDREALVTKIFQLGADMELDACCEWLTHDCDLYRSTLPKRLRAARRPKPPSLRQLALQALDQADKGLSESEWQQRSDTIRRALESLPE